MHCDRRAASRAAWIAGKSSATKMPMMAITTSSSTNVKPERVPSFIAQFLSQKKRLRREADVRRSLSLLANGSTVDARRENFATNRRRCREKCAKVGR
jgi:hypothetical protein